MSFVKRNVKINSENFFERNVFFIIESEERRIFYFGFIWHYFLLFRLLSSIILKHEFIVPLNTHYLIFYV